MNQIIEQATIRTGQQVVAIGPDKCACCDTDLVSQPTIASTNPVELSIPLSQPGRVILHCLFCSRYYGECEYCGEEFEAQRPWARFCGTRCRVASWRENNQDA